MTSRRTVHAFLLASVLPFVLTMGCGGGSSKTKITIYTSIYESVIAELDPIIEAEFPDIEVEWYQKGSEVVALKVNSEIAAGKIRADIIMTSDPFWYEELKEGGYLLAYESPMAADVPDELKDPTHHFVTVRMPVMVMTVNGSRLDEGHRPSGFDSLTDPEWSGRVTMGDPLSSGSTFTAVAALSGKYGWEFFEALRKNDVVSAGGNSKVLERVSTGEKEVGIILLENLLKAKKDNPDSPAEIVYPADGAILVPSPIAIIKTTDAPDAAKRIYDFMLSDAGQNAIVAGNMYSPIERIAAPEGARSWGEVYENTLIAWSPEYLRETMARRDEIKQRFSRIMFE